MTERAAGPSSTPSETPASRWTFERAWALARANAFVLLLLAATFFFRVLWATVVPAFQAPDETQHIAYIQSLGEDFRITPSDWISEEFITVGGLTGLGDVPYRSNNTQEFAFDSLDGPREDELDDLPRSLRTKDVLAAENTASEYPPTYYLLGSVVYRLLSGADLLTIIFGLRMLSAIISTGTVLFGYLALKRFFADEMMARSSAIIVAMLPMNAYMGAMVNVDVLVGLFLSLFIYLLTRAYDDGLSPRLNVALGATLAAGLLVKQTFLIALPMYAVLLFFLWCRKLLSPRQAALSLAVVLAMVAVLDGWLYLSGLVGTSASYPHPGEHEARSIRGFVEHFEDRWWDFSWTYNTMWGYFGWLDTPMSGRIFALIRTGSAIAAVGLAFYLISSVVERRADLKSLFYVLISVAYVSGWILVNYIRITSGEAWFLQGRYFLPILVPVIALLLRGALWFVPHAGARNVVLVALVVGVLWFQTDALAGYVVPRFYE